MPNENKWLLPKFTSFIHFWERNRNIILDASSWHHSFTYTIYFNLLTQTFWNFTTSKGSRLYWEQSDCETVRRKYHTHQTTEILRLIHYVHEYIDSKIIINVHIINQENTFSCDFTLSMPSQRNVVSFLLCFWWCYVSFVSINVLIWTLLTLTGLLDHGELSM